MQWRLRSTLEGTDGSALALRMSGKLSNERKGQGRRLPRLVQLRLAIRMGRPGHRSPHFSLGTHAERSGES
jgi:hypothetical protein